MSIGSAEVPGLSEAERERGAELVVMVNRLEDKVDRQAERIDELEVEMQREGAKMVASPETVIG